MDAIVGIGIDFESSESDSNGEGQNVLMNDSSMLFESRPKPKVKKKKIRKPKRKREDDDSDEYLISEKKWKENLRYEDASVVHELVERAGFSPFEMNVKEQELFPNYVEDYQFQYLDIRNFIVSEWKKNVNEFLSIDRVIKNLKDEYHSEVEPIWHYLTRHGHINSGVFNGWEQKQIQFPYKPPKVIIIGSGASGLICGRQLHQWGYEVVILEARDRIGGRVNTRDTLGTPVDMGAAIITGLIRNPLDNITTQLDLRTHVIGSNSCLMATEGGTIPSSLDDKISKLFDNLLENVIKWKDPSNDKSLGTEMERLIPPLPRVDSAVLNWYYANLEYACATDLSNLSRNHWDQDDPYDFAGDHLILVDGYRSMLDPLKDGLDIRYNHEVTKVEYGDNFVALSTSNGQVIKGDIAVITVPLGVLKSGWIEFDPPLPQWKRDSISAMGFGILNKLSLLFDKVFWDENLDWFGRVSLEENKDLRGMCYFWWNYNKIKGQPILLAIVAGKSGYIYEDKTDEEIIDNTLNWLMKVNRLNERPNLLKYEITRWSKEKYTGGSYSYIPPGASGEDYDQLAKTVENNSIKRLFFAGEHTSRFYPATVSGAYSSGLREAQKIHDYFDPPPLSEFTPPRINQLSKEREVDRRNKLGQNKQNASRRKATFQRGVRNKAVEAIEAIPITRGDEKFKYVYQPLFESVNLRETLAPAVKIKPVQRPSVKPKLNNYTPVPNGDNSYNPANEKSNHDSHSSKGDDNTIQTETLPSFNISSQSVASILQKVNDASSFIGLNVYGSFDSLQKNDEAPRHHSKPKKHKPPSEDRKKNFKKEVATIVVNRIGRNKVKANKEDFKYLCRKFTEKFVESESRNKGNYKMDPKKKTAIKKILDEYCQKHPVYDRSKKKREGKDKSKKDKRKDVKKDAKKEVHDNTDEKQIEGSPSAPNFI